MHIFSCNGSGPSTGKLSDLSPLAGLPLAHLACSQSRVSDLSPLAGMPLTELCCDHTLVSDLTPLKGMHLALVWFTPTKITDGIDAIRRMKSLKTIGLSGEDKDQFSPDEFWKKYDAGELGKPITTFRDPAFQRWAKEVAALPAQKQVEAVAKKLQELNPGFNGKVTDGGYGHGTPRVENGVVTEFGFSTDNVADISPVRALEGLRSLGCIHGVRGKFFDLSPLKGMPLTNLCCHNTKVSDLSPLKGMPLTNLNISSSPVSDLSPLKGTPLTSLTCSDTPVSDLTPLNGMPLTKLCCARTRVSDLSPLKGMQLTFLECDGTQVSDLSPLKGMPLTELRCAVTHVCDLSPLKGMPLTRLVCYGTRVCGLSPLKGMQLTILVCWGTPVSDLSPLEGMKLTEIYFTPKNITKGIDLVRRMKSLKTIGPTWENHFPPDVFWKKCDAGEFGKPGSAVAPSDRKPITTFKDPAFQRWIKEVAALPAEKQVEAVVKKLKELNRGFDGKVTGGNGTGTPKIENGVVTEFRFCTDNVTDISPVRALAGLKSLACAGSGPDKGKLADLSPLEGTPLSSLRVYCTQVSNLSPLRGMPLTTLHCNGTPVSDLSPLKGMPLTDLTCFATHVTDLSPLQGMPLTFLHCAWTSVSNLTPLKGMPLTDLAIDHTPVSNLSPVQGMALALLRCDQTHVSDLSPLEGMNLKWVWLTPKNVTKGMNVIRQMKSLKTIGLIWHDKEFPPAEFWKKYDAGEFNK